MLLPVESPRIAIAGAGSLRGKEMKQWLENSSISTAELRLLDEPILAGTLTDAGGEPAVVENIDETSFERVRFAFFTGSAAFSTRYVAQARQSGATVIDVSGGLTATTGAQLWIPALDPALPPPPTDRSGPRSLYLAPSAPSIVAILLSAAFSPLELERLAITFFEPASERGLEGVEELEAQVLKLLSFAPVPKTVFDAQVGFNMLSRFGEQSSEQLADTRDRIAQEVRGYLAGRARVPAISLIHAPVFYSHTFSACFEFRSVPEVDTLVERLHTCGLTVSGSDELPPDNVSVAGEPRPAVSRPEPDPNVETTFWLWGGADNLRVPVANAVAIAEKLLAC